MNISDPFELIVAAATGLVVGGIFFYGLWVTVQRIAATRHPGLLILTSFILRVAVVLGAVFAVGRGHLDRMLLCLIGFLIARWIVVRCTRCRDMDPAAAERSDASCN